MRILYFLDQEFPGRRTSTIQVANMGDRFARLGVPTRLFVRGVSISDRRELLGYYGLEPHEDFVIEPLLAERHGKPARWTGPRVLARLVDVLRKHAGPDTVIYARGLGAIEATRRAVGLARPLGIPVVYEVHKFYARTQAELYRTESLRPGKGPDYLEKKRGHVAKIRRREDGMLRTVDGLVCITKGIEDRLRERYGPDRPVALIPSAAREPDRVAGEDERDLDVVYLGDVGAKKGVRVLVDAMARLPDRRLLIHGRGREETAIRPLRDRIAKLGLEDRVTFGGWIEPARVPALLARARASVLPYSGQWTETAEFVSPLKAYELMLAGVPLVVTDLPALREVVRHDETALVVPPDDPVALAEALETLLSDRPRALRLAAAAREAARPFTWEGRARRVIEFLEGLRSRRGTAAD